MPLQVPELVRGGTDNKHLRNAAFAPFLTDLEHVPSTCPDRDRMEPPLPYHPALASRPRRWPIVLPFVVVVVLAAGWSGVWYYASKRAEAAIAGWMEREARVGRVYACGAQSISGYPFRIEVRCSEPNAELKTLQPSVTLKGKDLLVAAQIYQPTLLIGEVTGPLAIGETGKSPHIIANWTLAQTSVRGTPAAPERVSVVLDNPSFDRIGATQEPVVRAKRLELHGRMASGSARDNPVIDVALRLGSAVAPSLHPILAQPLDGDVTAVLRGLKDFAPKPWPDRFRQIQAAGGQIDVTNVRLQQGETLMVGSGALGLTPNGGLNGQLQVTVAGLDALLEHLGVDGTPPQGGGQAGLNRVAPVLGALDRMSPGLGNFARQQAVAGIAVGLGGQQTELEGKRAVSLPLRFQDGEMFLGRLRVGSVPPLF
jgi:hypothetical protein